MVEQPLLFIDSGIGGLSYLPPARKKCGSQHFIYVADNDFFPYGEKPQNEVLRRVLSLADTCITLFNPKVIVIACNTASVIALEQLRKRYTVPFIGVVPAVKPAAQRSKLRKIGIFATNRTVGDVYTENLIREFAPDCEIITYPGAETVSYIEKRYFMSTEKERKEYISFLANRFCSDGIDTLVLGCTHFVFLADELQQACGEKIDIVESREGVTKQLKRIVQAVDTFPAAVEYTGGNGGIDRLYCTKEDENDSVLYTLSVSLNIAYSGMLPRQETVL